MKAVAPKKYTTEDLETWRVILSEHRKKRDSQVCDIFLKGLEILDINEDEIPDLEEINKVLMRRTGFEGVLVEGLEEGNSFYHMLEERQFPVGNFIRSREDLSYTPAPDIVHDLYGHLPFYTDKAYSDFSYEFGKAASRYADRPELLRQFERFFWFTVEFGLVKTTQGVRIFGAGIASSTGECDYALSDAPTVYPFDIDHIRKQEFRIDEMQKILFCLENPEQLYRSLPELCARVEQDARTSA
ncbi:MAG: phenylalanine 4-monooxygenase [Bdellovibrionaceae bacterium]|nr:phenylalanine 4-monooxygenase [Pseudobdellovibrionaceae bacterium]